MIILQLSLVSLVLIMTTGCSTWSKLNDTEKGAVIGGGAGAVVGNVIAPGVGGTVVGGGLGAVGGGVIGDQMDRRREEDRRKRY